MTRPSATAILLLAALSAWACGAAGGTPARWPEGAAFAGLGDDGRWHAYVVRDGTPRRVRTATEPRGLSYHPPRRLLAYVGADGSVRLLALATGRERVLLRQGRDAYTQPAFAPDGKALYLARLPQGASAHAGIVRLHLADGRIERVAGGDGAHLEPAPDGAGSVWLTRIECGLECGRLVQTLWRLVPGGRLRPVLRRRGIAREPAPSADGRLVYFAADYTGPYKIWRCTAEGTGCAALTRGPRPDLSPAVAADGTVLFVRLGRDGHRVHRLRPGRDPEPLPLPAGVRRIRSLEICPCLARPP